MQTLQHTQLFYESKRWHPALVSERVGLRVQAGCWASCWTCNKVGSSARSPPPKRTQFWAAQCSKAASAGGANVSGCGVGAARESRTHSLPVGCPFMVLLGGTHQLPFKRLLGVPPVIWGLGMHWLQRWRRGIAVASPQLCARKRALETAFYQCPRMPTGLSIQATPGAWEPGNCSCCWVRSFSDLK